MSDYFYFLKQNWIPGAEALIEAGEIVDPDLDDIDIIIMPETISSGKVRFSNVNTTHFHSAEKLVDILVAGLLKFGFTNEKTEELINEILG